MILGRHLPAVCIFFLLSLDGSSVAAADGIDLTGTFEGHYTDKGRLKRRFNVRLRIQHKGEQFKADATNNTIWLTGLVVENKVFVEWEHASGEQGEGVLDILDAGNRLKGNWESASTSSHYGIWEFTRQ